MIKRTSKTRGVIRSLGLVFGDIGTSPLYTLTVVFLLTDPTEQHIMGVLSLIVWTLVLLVTVQYAWLATSLGRHGEGGTIVLREILTPLLGPGRRAMFVAGLSYVGISLMIGDGVITPAISILSAVEGLLLIPGMQGTGTTVLLVIAASVAVVLFVVQRHGTEKVSGMFGPLMVLWFLVLALSGLASVAMTPSVVAAINPLHAVHFLSENGMAGFIILSEVVLCATGGEALYADMGHLGRAPIVRAWNFVFFALVINYLGQGAFLVRSPQAKNVLFEMVYQQAGMLYVPFVFLSIIATVIASQAMISGMFSIVYQGIATRIFPMFRVAYTSEERRSQIYIGAVNWFLLAAVLFIMVEFRESHRLAAAYGLAVTGTMTLTGIMMTWIFALQRRYARTAAAAVVTVVSAVYLLSNTTKIPHGGYWSLVIAAVPLALIILYTRGQRRLYRELQPLPLDVFLLSYDQIYAGAPRIRGTALYFAKDAKTIPPYLSHIMIKNNIIYDDNIIVSIVRREDPFGATGFFKEDLAPGLRAFEIQLGYMEVPAVEEILREAGINEKVIFYGVEDIYASNVLWQIFSLIKKVTPSIVQFYQLPSNKLHGVVTKVEM
jgi:KUP system potassium uptake protein